jgi:UDP-N-acetylglucosamine 2-epimerase (non-hydrolysing)
MKKEFTIVTLLGIRPDIIRMFKIIEQLDNGQKEHGYKHIFCHTGQHFDHELDTVFYEELGVRSPDWNMNTGKTLKERGGSTTYVQQTALMFEKTAEMLEKFKPDAVLYLGDTNSVLSSIIVSRARVPIIHVEAGGRSFDWRMPEEKCRTIIDNLTDAFYCYTQRHKENLLSEGVPENRITVIGNVIYDALDTFIPMSEKSTIMETLGVAKKTYTLVTLHREENTSDEITLSKKIDGLIQLAEEIPVILTLMPRVRKNLETFNLIQKLENSKVITSKPLGYFDFLKLQNNAKLIITDSGTVQEEAYILGIPALVCRLSTERPETIRGGGTILSNDNLYKNAKKALTLNTNWDRMIMNPTGKSPSLVTYLDLIKKIKEGYFENVRNLDNLPDIKNVREAYGNFN